MPTGDALFVQSDVPTFWTGIDDLAAIGITRTGATVDAIHTHDGRTLGPFQVVTWTAEGDGLFTELGLQS